jgi:parallel beta-helix repeat protein
MIDKKNFLVVTILILLVFLVTACSGVLPKPTKGVISGRVLIPPAAKQLSKDISGWVGAAGAEVTIVDANGVKHTVITDENGYYNFENIAVKANTVVTATVKVDGKTMVLKTVIDKAVGKDQKYDSGAMTPESTALALVVEKLIAEGKEQAGIDLGEIKGTNSFAALVEQVETVIEEQGNVTEDPEVTEAVDETTEEIITPPTPPATPPSGPSAVPVSSVSIDQEDQTLVIGATLELTATIEPANATNKNVTWETSAEDVATVDNDGVVTAVGDGDAAITVTTASGNKADTITITVSKVYNQTQKTPHNTIQGAIDEAEDHDTILVGAGIYSEKLIILKSLSLLGPNADIAGVGVRKEEATLDGSNFGANERGFSIAANNVTIKGFTVKNYPESYGILVLGDSATTPLEGIAISNNIICDNGLTPKGFRAGLYVKNASVVIENNLVENNHNGGIELTTGVYGSIVRGNTIRGNRNHGVHIGSTGAPAPTATVLIEDNLVEFNGSGDATPHDPTSYSIPGHAGVIVWDAGAKIINNRIINNNPNGIVWIHFDPERWAQGGNKINENYYIISDNEIEGNSGDGIVLFTLVSTWYAPRGPVDPPASPYIEKNDIIANGFGIVAVGSSSPLVEGNRFITNGGGLVNTWAGAIIAGVTYPSVTINAIHNWWGDASGPCHDQDNPEGTGNSVSDNVDFNPWCTNEGCTEYSEE